MSECYSGPVIVLLSYANHTDGQVSFFRPHRQIRYTHIGPQVELLLCRIQVSLLRLLPYPTAYLSVIVASYMVTSFSAVATPPAREPCNPPSTACAAHQAPLWYTFPSCFRCKHASPAASNALAGLSIRQAASASAGLMHHGSCVTPRLSCPRPSAVPSPPSFASRLPLQGRCSARVCRDPPCGGPGLRLPAGGPRARTARVFLPRHGRRRTSRAVARRTVT
jgi:hypothetical protein